MAAAFRGLVQAGPTRSIPWEKTDPCPDRPQSQASLRNQCRYVRPAASDADFNRAVHRADGETVVFSWIEWPDKATRDAAWQSLMQDERMAGPDRPFDGKRMIFGGFVPIVDG